MVVREKGERGAVKGERGAVKGERGAVKKDGEARVRDEKESKGRQDPRAPRILFRGVLEGFECGIVATQNDGRVEVIP